MPTVIRKDENTLALVYDGCKGKNKGHLNRCIGLAEISLPISVEKTEK